MDKMRDKNIRLKRAAAGSLAGIVLLAGCATTPSSPGNMQEQMDAARKVVGAMAPSKGPAEKYSPLTGRHYSGALEFEPGTGVKLLAVEE